MRILYDHQIFQMQNFGGISRYFFELITHSQAAGFKADLSLWFSANEYLNGIHGPRARISLSAAMMRRSYRLANSLNVMGSISKINSGTYDIFHPTFFDEYFLQSKKIPYVITVYDLINEKFPQYFQNNQQFIEKRKHLILGALKVIAISQSTKRDLLEIYGLPPSKIEVTHLAESLTSLKSEPVIELPEKYILFVGKRDGYKNFGNAFEALRPLLIEDPNLNLVCAGGGPFTSKEIHKFSESGNQAKVKFIHFQNDAQLKYLYEKAACFLFPSLYEGFGIPVLEAFASGCPVCLSQSSSLPEVGGSAALYFDPNSVEEIGSSVKRALALGPNNQFIVSGFHVLKNFSWSQTAELTSKVYEACRL